MCTAAIRLCRLDHVYYGNRLADTRDCFDGELLVKYCSTPIDERANTGKQIMGEEACAVIIKWANDPNLKLSLFQKY
ncbi:hypothetical protein OS493_024469 [Desmophyllum pertusum]|uniref:Uncharacterized protein n=1 Tax=Desmophyllum pertusum TaxID=174260 RepID=A0A9W9YAL6_9CNID|nr:hypothetical protein OS493_024469 [Desmophyllum pertusum]